MDITKFVNTIKEQVAQNQLAQAIEELKNFMQNHEFYDEVIMQSARYSDIESQIRLNTVSKNDADIEKNKIRLAILQIADNIQKHVIKSATNNPETPAKNKVDIDGNGNIILQDVNGGTITVNYNDTESLKDLFQSISENQIFEIKQIIGGQNELILKEIRSIQDKLAEQNTNNKIQEYTADLDDFFKELAEIKMKSAKDRLLKNYSLLHEYEELLILEDDPKRKMRYQREIETLKSNILQNEKELKNSV